MNIKRKILTIVLALTGAVAPATAMAERVILSDPDYKVLRKTDSCSTTVPLLVYTNRPQLFAENSEALNSLIVASRAIVAFECPDVRGLRLKAFNTDTGAKLFEGGATEDTRWQVVARYRADSVDNQASIQDRADFSVARLKVGMSLDSVVKTLRDEYGQQGVKYQDYSRTILAGSADCPLITGRTSRDGFPVGARCIRASFTSTGQPTLDRLTLAQAVPGNQVTDGIKALQERYGRPSHDNRMEPNQRERLAGYGEKIRFGWGGSVQRPVDQGRRRETHQLEADLSTNDTATMLIIRLFAPSKEVVNEKPTTFGF